MVLLEAEMNVLNFKIGWLTYSLITWKLLAFLYPGDRIIISIHFAKRKPYKETALPKPKY